jgi:DNA-binding transcriptional ArsR family regulator
MKDSQNQNKIKKMKKKLIGIRKVINSKHILRIILLLFIYKKLSLSQLSKIFERTKATMIHHLKKMEELELINIMKVGARGPIDANVYELKPELYEILNNKEFFIKKLEGNKFREIIQFNIIKYKIIFDFLKGIIEEANQFYNDFYDFKTESLQNSSQKLKDFFKKNTINFNMVFLTKEGFKSYEEIKNRYLTQLRELSEKERKQKKNSANPNIILYMDFQLKEIVEYDKKKKKFYEIFDAFD